MLSGFVTAAVPAPFNDNIENALLLNGPVGVVSNLTAAGATIATTDPLPSAGRGSIWFRYDSSLTTTGAVRFFGLDAGNRLMMFETNASGLAIQGSLTTGGRITNRVEQGKTYFFQLEATPANTNIIVRWLFPTLFASKPDPAAPLAFIAPGTTSFEITNIEPDIQFQSVQVRGWDEFHTNGFILANISNPTLPLTFNWTNPVPTTNSSYAIEALTTDGELRQSVTNIIKFLPGHDAFGRSKSIEPGGGEIVVRTVGSTRETGEPHSPGPGSVWYRWTPTQTGRAQFEIGSASTNEFLVYTGSTLADLADVPLTLVAGSTVREGDVTAGQTYYIAIYDTTSAVRQFRYSVPTMDLVTPTPRTGLKAPGVVELLAGMLPSGVQSVTYRRGLNVIGTAAQPPYSILWTNGLTGNVPVTAEADGINGPLAFSKVAILSFSPGNDSITNAVALPGDLISWSILASQYLATHATPEPTGASGVWWVWNPVQDGFGTFTTVGGGQIRSNGVSIFASSSGLCRFSVKTGVKYEFDLYGNPSPDGFIWSLQSSPLQLVNSGTAIRIDGRPFTFEPVVWRSTEHVTRVDYLENGQVVGTASSPLFSVSMTRPMGSYPLSMLVVLDNGTVVDGGAFSYNVGPANDLFADATELPPNQVRQTNTVNSFLATSESSDPLGSGSVWWKWTPKYGGITTIKLDTAPLAGSQPNYFVSAGDSLTNLPVIAYSHDTNGFTFATQAGVTYHFGFTGNFGNNLWKWRLSEETLVLRTFSPNAWNSPLRVYATNYNTDLILPDLTLVANGQNIDTLPAPDFSKTWEPQPGVYTFYASYSSPTGPVASVPANVTVQVFNDNIGFQTELPQIDGIYQTSGNLKYATREPNELVAGWVAQNFPKFTGSIWYKFTAAFTGPFCIAFDAGNTNIALRTSLWQDGPTRVQIPQANFGKTFLASVTKGNTYYLSIATPNSADEPLAFHQILPPVNDNFSDAADITGNPPSFTGNILTATLGPGETNASSAVWYRWTPPTTGDTTLVFDELSDPVNVNVYFGASVDALLLHAQSSWYAPYNVTGFPKFRTVAGETYEIAIARGAGNPAMFKAHLTFEPVDGPPNDFRRNAQLISGAHVSIQGNLDKGTRELQEPANWVSTVWYRWVAPASGVLQYHVNIGSSLSVQVADPPNTSGRMVVNAGQTYELMVSEPPPGNSLPTFPLILDLDPFLPPPSNDNFDNRIVIRTNDYTITSTLFGTSREIAWEPELTTWWEILPAKDGFAIATISPAVAGEIRAYYGSDLNSLVLKTSGTNIFVPLTNGVSTRLMVGNATPGNFQLHVTSIYDRTPNDMFANAIRLQGTNAASVSHNYLASVETGEPSIISGTSARTVWWNWYSENLGVATLQIESSFPAVAAIYTGDALPVLQKVNSVLVGATTNSIQFLAKPDTVYRFQVDTIGPNRSVIRAALQERILANAPNDNFAQRTVVSGGWITNLYSMRGATRERGEPVFDPANTRSIWFEWDGGVGGQDIVTATIENTPLELAVYVGDAVDQLSLVAKGRAPVSFVGFMGQNYKICVESTAAMEGEVSLKIQSGRSFGTFPTSLNLVTNGSFEIGASPTGWTVESTPDIRSYVQQETPAPQGNNTLALWQEISQSLLTTPGKSYQLRCAVRSAYDPGSLPFSLNISLSGQTVALTNLPAGSTWVYLNIRFTASNTASVLKFSHTPGFIQLDVVSLVEFKPLAPIFSIDLPGNLMVVNGNEATLYAGVNSAIPLSYQWFFNSTPLLDQTNSTLLLSGISDGMAGAYSLVASNSSGVARSGNLILLVRPPEPPSILAQPAGERAVEKSFIALTGLASGEEPLSYQWFKNGEPVANATNRTLQFAGVGRNDAGTYTLKVENVTGSVLSLPAVLDVTDGSANVLALQLGNFDPNTGVLIPVFQADGFTKLSGSKYLIQLYTGTNEDLLVPMGRPVPFLSGYDAGRFNDATIDLAGNDENSFVFAQYRAWDASVAKTFEEARAIGAMFGVSALQTLDFMSHPVDGRLKSSFAMERRLPNFSLGVFSISRFNPSGSGVTLHFDGMTGGRYLLEQNDGTSWRPLFVIENPNSSFDLVAPANVTNLIFRSRFLN